MRHLIHISIYTWYMTHHVICLECLWYMSGICFPSHLVICLVHVRDIPDICFPSHLVICQGYTRHMTLFVKCPGPAAAAMRRLDWSAHGFRVLWGFNVTGTVQRAPPLARPFLVAGRLLGGAAAAAAAAPPRPAPAPPQPAAASPRPPAILLPFT